MASGCTLDTASIVTALPGGKLQADLRVSSAQDVMTVRGDGVYVATPVQRAVQMHAAVYDMPSDVFTTGDATHGGTLAGSILDDAVAGPFPVDVIVHTIANIGYLWPNAAAGSPLDLVQLHLSVVVNNPAGAAWGSAQVDSDSLGIGTGASFAPHVPGVGVSCAVGIPAGGQIQTRVASVLSTSVQKGHFTMVEWGPLHVTLLAVHSP